MKGKMNLLLGFIPILVAVGVVMMLGHWHDEVEALNGQMQALTSQNQELKYIIKGKTNQTHAISHLSASDYSPRLNQDITLRFKVDKIVDYPIYVDDLIGKFSIDNQECKAFLRLDSTDHTYYMGHRYYGSSGFEDKHLVRIVNMPNTDTKCTITFTVTHVNYKTYELEIADSRKITLDL